MNEMLERILSFLITLSVLSVFAAIAVDFLKYHTKNTVKKSRKSIVATGSMVGFYIVYYLLIRFRIGSVESFHPVLIFSGTAMIVAGAVGNILGRFSLKENWANHIKIYETHTLVTSGLYSFVRHPLYASIILMLTGGCIAYRNWLSAVLTVAVFIPFMYYRARQEEDLLLAEFPQYQEYQKQAGMFLPKWRRR